MRLAAFILASFCVSAAASAAELVIHNATVIDGAPRVADVVINGERITSVGACNHPKQAAVIDATGKYLIPGLVDMHAHVLLHRSDAEGNVEPRLRRGDVLRTFRLLLAHGVTTVRDPGAETEAAVTFRRLLQERKIDGPRVLTAGRIINASPFNPEPFQPSPTADDVRNEIRWQAAAGVDFIKIYSSMTPELTKVAVGEARKHGLSVIGHLQRTTWTEAAKLGVSAISHGAPFSPEYLPEKARAAYEQSLFGRIYWLEHVDLGAPAIRELTDALVANRVAMDPTLIAYHTKFFGNDRRWTENRDNALIDPEMLAAWRTGHHTRAWTPEMFAAAQKAWPKQLAFTKLLFDRGVLLTVGSDTPGPWIVPGASVHDELELLAAAGLTPRQLLTMATRNAARAMKREREFGAISVGMSADLVLLAKNPLEDIRNTRAIELVIARGTRYEPKALLATPR